jgi:hypothetical protein
MRLSHSLDRVGVAFDDHRLIDHAGLLLPATLAMHLELRALVDRHVDLGAAPGRAHAGDKLLTLVASALPAATASMTRTLSARAGPRACWAIGCRRTPPWARSCAASAGATSASSMP